MSVGEAPDALPRGVPRVGLVLGPLAWLLLRALPAPEGLPPAAWAAAGVLLWMATWWIAEAVPLAVTALLPLVLFPLLGVLPFSAAATPYANPVIFLFLGGFVLARGIEACGLHRRVAYGILGAVGSSPRALIGGFMAATALISMWVSNTATVLLMYPMALSVIAIAERESRDQAAAFGTALLLSLVYASGIGGTGTLIGSPPNAILAGYLSESLGRSIGFGQWMLVGVPVVLVGVPLAWWLLVRWLVPVGRAPITGELGLLRAERAALGRASGAEWTVGLLVLLVATAWIARPAFEDRWPLLTDAGIALSGALLLFTVPAGGWRAGPVLRGEDLASLPWPVLLLFGGGLALGEGITASGLAAWLGDALSATRHWPVPVVAALLTGGMLFLTELASNTASASIFLPIVLALAGSMGVTPEVFALPVAIAASCAFMLPVATPPAAIVYASGRLPIRVMAAAGLWINLLMWAVLVLASWLLVGPVFGP
jgi:solute carrier family 13 (sodium-dependent dicarboxylate transporter), member 2/3/5